MPDKYKITNKNINIKKKCQNHVKGKQKRQKE